VTFLPIKGLEGSDILKVRGFKTVTCPYTGETYIACPRIEPDVAIMHGQRADVYGNVQLEGPPLDHIIMAKAAKRVIISVEEIVPTDKIRECPVATSIPHYMVDAIVEMPYGAHPASCHGYYESDRDHVREYARASETPEGLQEYLDRYVYGVRDHGEYLEKVKGVRI
jgi:glutaconate CoA-transferase subunit A